MKKDEDLIRLKFVGRPYTGSGADMSKEYRGRFVAVVGDVVPVPAHEAQRLIHDYGSAFQVVEGSPLARDIAIESPLDLNRLIGKPGDLRVCAIVTTFNGIEMTARCLRSLTPTEGVDLRVFVVDNCSTDGTYEWLRKNGVPHMQSFGRCSVPRALNYGVEETRKSKPDYYLIMNNDVEIPYGYIDQLLDCARDNPEAGWVVGYHEDALPESYKPFDTPVEIDAEMLSGDASATLIRAKALEEVGPWDERFGPRYGEDEDMLTRFKLAGWKQIRMPVAYGGKSGGYTESCPGEASQIDCHHRALRIYFDKWSDYPKSTKRYPHAMAWVGDAPCNGTAFKTVQEVVPQHRRGKRAAIIQNGHFGDIIWTFKVAEELKRRGYTVTWYAVPPYIQIVDCCPSVDEIIDTTTLDVPSTKEASGLLFERALGPARLHAEAEGFDLVAVPQISLERQDEFLRSSSGYIKFMYDSIGFHPESLRFELRKETDAVRADLADVEAVSGGERTVFLNLASESVTIRTAWSYWDEVITLLHDLRFEVWYNEPPDRSQYKWRGKTQPNILGKLRTPKTLLYLASEFNFYISTSSGPLWSAFYYDVPALVLLPRGELGNFKSDEVLKQYAMARQAWIRQWQCADLVLNDRGRPELLDPAQLVDLVERSVQHNHDIRAWEIEQYADLFKGY